MNVWTARSKGRALAGQRAVRIVEGQRGQNVTVCLAISPLLGLVHWVVFPGGMTQPQYCDFLMELAELLRYNNDEYVLLCDNVPSHLNAPNFGDQGTLKYLPKYSPFINACDMAGSCLEAAVKQNCQNQRYSKKFMLHHEMRLCTIAASGLCPARW